MSNKYYYAIIRNKTGKLITESGNLPIFWNKRNADYRAKDFIDVTVVPISATELAALIKTNSNDTE